MQEYGKELYTHGKGVYFNEPDYYLDNWKEEYWGSMERYDKLLAVKKRVDPGNMFWCHHCVGSDELPAAVPGPLVASPTSSSARLTLTDSLVVVLMFLTLVRYVTD